MNPFEISKLCEIENSTLYRWIAKGIWKGIDEIKDFKIDDLEIKKDVIKICVVYLVKWMKSEHIGNITKLLGWIKMVYEGIKIFQELSEKEPKKQRKIFVVISKGVVLRKITVKVTEYATFNHENTAKTTFISCFSDFLIEIQTAYNKGIDLGEVCKKTFTA